MSTREGGKPQGGETGARARTPEPGAADGPRAHGLCGPQAAEGANVPHPEGASGPQAAVAASLQPDEAPDETPFPGIDLVDEEAVDQEVAREKGARGEVPALQSPLRVNPLAEGSDTLPGRYSRPVSETVVAAVRKVVRIVLQLGLIMAVCLAGERISDVLPIDVPGNICSMVLLLVFLVSGVIRMDSISDAADFLLDNMAVFFIPAAVAIMGSFDMLAGSILKLVLICLITTVLVFFVTSFTVSTVSNLMARGEERRAARAQGAAASETTGEAR